MMSKRSSLLFERPVDNTATNIPTNVLDLSWVLKYHFYFNLLSWGKAYLIDDQSCDNNKQSGYVQIHERDEKI